MIALLMFTRRRDIMGSVREQPRDAGCRDHRSWCWYSLLDAFAHWPTSRYFDPWRVTEGAGLLPIPVVAKCAAKTASLSGLTGFGDAMPDLSIPNRPIEGPSAWVRAAVHPEDWLIELSADCLDEIRRVVDEIRAHPLPTILRSPPIST